MTDKTRKLWIEQNRHPGDRLRLFSAVAKAVKASNLLYPGSFVDIAPSFVFDSVTYVDMDLRAAAFFSDGSGVDEIIGEHRSLTDRVRWTFVQGDYTKDLGLPPGGFDLLVSLYAGFVSEYCTRYLKVGGMLLVAPSHGDVAMASIDPRYELEAIVQARDGTYKVSRANLASFLVPKRTVTVTREMLHATGRGIGYTRSAFAYLFRLTV